MSRYEVIIRDLEKKDKSFEESILISFEYEKNDSKKINVENIADVVEVETMDFGLEFMRKVYVKTFELYDKEISDVKEHEDSFCSVRYEGYESLKIVSRIGIVEPERQVCKCDKCDKHFMPINKYLPDHNGAIITRGLVEWCCLLPQELPFESVSRMLGWMTKEEHLLSKNTIRKLVKEEGKKIRELEKKEVEKLSSLKDLSNIQPALVSLDKSRRKAGWPKELNSEIAKLLETENPKPPESVNQGDWERVLLKCKEKKYSVEELRKLGPEIKEGQVIVNVDEVLVRAEEKRKFNEIRTAKVLTKEGYRYLSGTGSMFIIRLYLFILLCGGENKLVTLLGDGARWIKSFFKKTLKALPLKELVLDWYHLRKKILEYSSMICSGKIEKGKFLCSLIISLWNGKTEKALFYLKNYEDKARNKEKLKALIGYVDKNIKYIPDYSERKRNFEFNGSGQVEKANDLLVARRQKNKGMHWSIETSDSLVALKTLILNRQWDDYWVNGRGVSLAA